MIQKTTMANSVCDLLSFFVCVITQLSSSKHQELTHQQMSVST